VTTVYVTHDQVEAMTMGHRVAVLRDGNLQQCDARVRSTTPRESFRGRIHRLTGDEHAAVPAGGPAARRGCRDRDCRRPRRRACDCRVPAGDGRDSATGRSPPHPDRRGSRFRGVRHLLIDHDGEERRIVSKVDAPFVGAVGDNVRSRSAARSISSTRRAERTSVQL